jgi:hypothetical protein
MTTDGWKALDPNKAMKDSPGLKVTLLKEGDILIKEDGSKMIIRQIVAKFAETTVYNFEVEGTHDYYADGYWVHNLMMLKL